jgi:hypothetical protein
MIIAFILLTLSAIAIVLFQGEAWTFWLAIADILVGLWILALWAF